MALLQTLRTAGRRSRSGRRAALLSVAGLVLLAAPLRAQEGALPFNEIRALNLARNTGVTLNGGLSVYSPASCMFSTSAPGNSCLVRRDAEGFLFRFLGGAPGWQVLNQPPTRETELLIAPDGRSVRQVVYNGAPRPAPGAS